MTTLSSLSVPKSISEKPFQSNSNDAEFKMAKSFLLKQSSSKGRQKGKGKSKSLNNASSINLLRSRKVSGLLIPNRSLDVFDSQNHQPLSSHSLANSNPSRSSPIIVTRSITPDPINNPNDSFNVRSTYLLMNDELWAWNSRVDAQGVELVQSEQENKNGWKWAKEVFKLPQPCLDLEILPTSELSLFTKDNRRIFIEHQFLPSSNPKLSNLFKINHYSESPSSSSSSSSSSSYNYIHSISILSFNSSNSKKLIRQAKESGLLKKNGLELSRVKDQDQNGEEEEEIVLISNPIFKVSSLEIKVVSESKSDEISSSASNEKSSKKKRGRNSAIDIIDEADASASSSVNSKSSDNRHESLLKPTGSLKLQIGFILDQADNVKSSAASEKVNRFIKIAEVDLSTAGVGIGKVEDIKRVQIGGENTLGWIDTNGTLSFTDFSLSNQETINFTKPKVFHLKSSLESSSSSLIQSFEFLSNSHLFLSSFSIKDQQDQVDILLQVFLLDLDLISILNQQEIVLNHQKTKSKSNQQETELNLISSSDLKEIEKIQIWSEVVRKGGKKLELLIRVKPNQNPGEKSSKSTSTSKSQVFEIEYSIPNESVLIQAIKSSELNKKYLAFGPASSTTKVASKESSGLEKLSKEERNLISDLRKIEGESKGKEIDEKFTNWLKIEESRIEREWREKLNGDASAKVQDEDDDENENDNGEGMDLDDVKKSKSSSKGKKSASNIKRDAKFLENKGSPKVKFEREFVKSLLVLALPPSTSKSQTQTITSSHSPKIISHLLSIGVLSNGLYSSCIQNSSDGSKKSILLRLKDFGDWSNISIGMQTIKDLLEEELALCLVDRIKNDSSASIKEDEKDEMSLKDYLAKLISLPVSPPSLRKSLKEYVKEADDVIRLLEILGDWLKIDGNDLLGNQMDEEQNPDVDNVISFTTHLLDVFFPLLLSTSTSHPLILSISESLAELSSNFNLLSKLISPLKVFDQIQSDYNLLDPKLKNNNSNQEILIKKPISMKVLNGGGISNVLEFDLNQKSNVGLGAGAGNGNGKKKDRLQRLEDSARVGPYSIEVLDI